MTTTKDQIEPLTTNWREPIGSRSIDAVIQQKST
jgi:hypothetical protein